MKVTRHLAIASLVSFIASQLNFQGQVVINEFAYDDSGTDDNEFVELFNAGASAVDISGWTVIGRDNGTVNPSATVPGGTILAPGAYYVIGNAAVPNVNQVVAANFLENDAEQLELWNGPAGTSTLIDGVVYEGNKGPTTGGTSYGALTPEMTAQVGARGYWGNFQSGHVNGQTAQGTGSGLVLVSQSRYIDGLDSNNNGRDFGLRRATPGAVNATGTGTSYLGPDVNGAVVGSQAPGLYGSFVNPRVVDPTAVSQFNPGAISASPQGGNAVTVWDTEFGGTGGGLDTVMQGNGMFNMLVYIDPRLTAAADSEEWVLGIGGGSDALHNFVGVTGTVNGSTGVGWAFRRDGTTRTLRLIDFGEGGPDSTWTILGTITLADGDLGWHVLSIDINGTTVTGVFDSTVFNGTTVSGLTGNLLYVSYREGFASNTDPLLRPLTIDMIPEPSTYALGAVALAAFCFLRRRKQIQ
jgi:hypothetical protein